MSTITRALTPMPILAAFGAALALSACDSVKNDFVSKCRAVTGASSSDCDCAAGKVKEVLGSEGWSIAGYILKGDRARAETELAKKGLGGLFGFIGQWSMAMGVAEQQCRVRGLSRM